MDMTVIQPPEGYVAILVPLLFFLVTIHITLKQLKSLTYGKIRERLFELNKIEVDHPYLFNSLGQKEISPEWLAEEGRAHYVFMFLSLYEEVFFQYRTCKLLDKEEYEIWENRLRNHLKKRNAVMYYWKQYYSKEASKKFKDYVNSLICPYNNCTHIRGKKFFERLFRLSARHARCIPTSRCRFN